METKKLKIIIVDDNEMFRSAAKLFLQKELNCEVIAEASDGKQFLELSNIYLADVVLMDIQMPETDGINATKKWCQLNSKTKVIAVTMFTDKVYLLPLIQAGFKGCVFKTNLFSEILKAIDTVMAGGLYYEQNLPVE
jgi:DNA-binding NarL/FixJ family response regulator